MQVLVIVCYNRKWFVQNGPTKFPHCSRNLLLVPIFTEESPPCYLVCCYIFLKCFRKSESLVSLLDFPIMSFVVLIPLSWAYVWLILDHTEPIRASNAAKSVQIQTQWFSENWITRKVIRKSEMSMMFPENHQKASKCPDFLARFPGKSSESLEMSRFSGEVSGKVAKKSEIPRFSGDYPGKSPETLDAVCFGDSFENLSIS